MTALAGTRPGSVKMVRRDLRPLAAGAKVYQGALAVAIVGGATSVGYYRNGISSPNVVAVGRFTQTVDNTSGGDGALSAEINFFTDRWLFLALNDTVTAVTAAARESACFVLDDQTVTGNGEANGTAGTVYDVTSEGVWFEVRRPNQLGQGVQPGVGLSFFARAIATSLAAYAGTGTGTLTASGTGAIGAQDGVTLAAGDIVFLPEGITNLTAASDAGPYEVVNPGGTGIKYVLTRPTWWETGNTIPGQAVEIGGEGTFWGGTEWKSFAAKAASTIDTSAPKLYPGRVSQSVTLVGGTKTITNVPILAADSGVAPVRTTANTSSLTTGGYALNGAPTPGVLGTATMAVFATVAAGTINVADVSTLTVTITNW